MDVKRSVMILNNVIALLMCLFLSGACIADEGKKGGPREKSIIAGNEIYSLSALDVQSTRIFPVLQEELDEIVHSRISAEDAVRISEITRYTFFSKLGAREAITAALARNLSEGEQRIVLEWLRSDIGGKITLLERAAAQPEARAGVVAYSKKLQHKPLSMKRTLLMQKFKRKIINKGALDRIIVVTEAVKKLAEEYAYGGRHLSYEKSLKKTVKFIDVVRATVNRRLFNHIRYSYRDLGDGELKNYLDFISSDTGQKYLAVSLHAFADAVERAGKRMGADIEAMAASGRKR